MFLALLTQVACRIAFGNWKLGAAAAIAWAISREVTQAEYRWIEQFGEGRRANMPWWGGLDPQVWQTLDPWLDWTLPSAAVLVVAVVTHRHSVRPRSA